MIENNTNKMDIHSSEFDSQHFTHTYESSKDFYNFAKNCALSHYSMTNAMCSRYHGVLQNEIPIYTDFIAISPLYENDYIRRIQVRDSTNPLKLWLLQHKKNPYPSKPEKIMLAILAKMTLTQVSTWFANARRRLKRDYPDVEYIGSDSLNHVIYFHKNDS